LRRGELHQRLLLNNKASKFITRRKKKNLVDEKIEYARSAYLNARRTHIKSGIGYKTGNKHNSRVNTGGQEFIKFTKINIQHANKQNIKTTNNASYINTNASHLSHMSNHDFDASYILIRNKIKKNH
jgi:hypothetical protein